MDKRVMLLLSLIPSIVIAGNDGNSILSFFTSIITAEPVKKGASDAVQKIVSGTLYAPLAVVGIMVYKKWICNGEGDEKRARIAKEIDTRLAMLGYLDREISRLQSSGGLTLQDERILNDKIKMREQIDRALMNSQYNNIKPNTATPDGTLCVQGAKILNALPS